MHTNFKLGVEGEYLGLFSPELPRRVADEIAPAYPGQRSNISYGRLAKGDAVKEKRTAGDWIEIEHPAGAHAYVAAKFIELGQAAEEAKRVRLAAGELGLDIYDMRGRLEAMGLRYL